MNRLIKTLRFLYFWVIAWSIIYFFSQIIYDLNNGFTSEEMWLMDELFARLIVVLAVAILPLLLVLGLAKIFRKNNYTIAKIVALSLSSGALIIASLGCLLFL